MKRKYFVPIFVVLILVSVFYISRNYWITPDLVFILNENKPVSEDSIYLAMKAVDLAGQGDFDTMQVFFDDNMKTYYPAQKIHKLWDRYTRGTGRYQRKVSLKANKWGKMDEVFVQCEFEKCTTDYRILIDEQHQIAAFEPNSYLYMSENHS